MRTEKGLPVFGMVGTKKGAIETAARSSATRRCSLVSIEETRNDAETAHGRCCGEIVTNPAESGVSTIDGIPHLRLAGHFASSYIPVDSAPAAIAVGTSHLIEQTVRGPQRRPQGPARFAARRSRYGKSNRYRPRHDQFVRRGHGRQERQGHRELGRAAHDALDRRLHRRRRAAGRPAGQAPGGHQPGAHLLRGQAPHRPALRRPDGRQGQGARPLQDREGAERRRMA